MCPTLSKHFDRCPDPARCFRASRRFPSGSISGQSIRKPDISAARPQQLEMYPALSQQHGMCSALCGQPQISSALSQHLDMCPSLARRLDMRRARSQHLHMCPGHSLYLHMRPGLARSFRTWRRCPTDLISVHSFPELDMSAALSQQFQMCQSIARNVTSTLRISRSLISAQPLQGT
jgi:hypothetical protein